MSATEIAKEAIRIASTAGLSKDVIDLLKEKITILDEKGQVLTQENNTLKAENYDLRKRLEVLEQDTTHAQQPEDFDDITDNILKMLFDHPDGISMEWLSSHLGVEEGVVHYQFDLLFREKFARQLTIGESGPFGSNAASFGLTIDGRAYVIKKQSS
jgi:regulator of replication initiation timing